MLTQNVLCQICSLSVAPDKLDDHVWRDHLDPELGIFRCNIENCSEGFNTPTELYDHVWSKHLDPELGISRCNIEKCSAGFSTSKELGDHIRDKHTFDRYITHIDPKYIDNISDDDHSNSSSPISLSPYSNPVSPRTPFQSPSRATSPIPTKVDGSGKQFSTNQPPTFQPQQPPTFQPQQPPTFQPQQPLVPPTLTMGPSFATRSTDIFNCSMCNQRFNSRAALVAHLQTHSMADAMRSHTRINHFEPTPPHTTQNEPSHAHQPVARRAFKCPMCHESFESAGALRDHLTTKEHPMKYGATHHIDLMTQQINTTPKHMQNHFQPTGKPIYRCEICGKSFPLKDSLKRHKNTHLPKDQRPFKCPYAGCGRTFSFSLCLTRHIKGHTGHNLYRCLECDHTTPSRRELITHSLKHQQDLPKLFICSTCQKRFATKGLLNTHEAIHTKKIWKCNKCKEVFYSRASLVRHNAWHKNPLVYTCKIQDCENGDAYTNPTGYHNHLKIVHGLARDIPCPRRGHGCNLMFYCNEDLEIHLSENFVCREWSR